MTPKLITTDADYRAALEQVRLLKQSAPGSPERLELEHWTLLLAHYRRTRQRGEERRAAAARLERQARLDSNVASPLPPAPMRPALGLFFLGAALLVYLRLMYHVSFFPAFFEGEEAKSLDLAKAAFEYARFTHSWWASFKGGALEYNKGYAWPLIPFFIWFGYDVRIIMFVLPAFFSLFLAAFFAVYRRTYPRGSLLSFVLMVLFSVLCLSLRRYKWHSLTYVAALSVYLFFMPRFYGGLTARQGRWLKVLAVFLFAGSSFLYFGGMVYAVPFFGLVFYFSSREQRRRELWIGTLALGVVALLFAGAYNYNDLWSVRIREEFQYILDDFTLDGLRERWWATRDFFFTVDLTLPFLGLFLVGLVASLRRIRRGDNFALINLVLLLSLWAFELSIQGLNNPDQLNWSMIPLLGVLLIGSDTVLAWLRDRFRYGVPIGAALVALLGWSEMRHYLVINRETSYQPYVGERNTMTQAALVLMMIRDHPADNVQYYLPAPTVPVSEGGFDYRVSLMRVDFRPAIDRVLFFRNPEGLRWMLYSQPAGTKAMVYESVGELAEHKDIHVPEDAMDPAHIPLLYQRPTVIHPYRDIYRIDFMVREFQMPTGPAALRLRPQRR
jgi:hypothetical protein